MTERTLVVEKIVVIGAAGFGRESLDVLEAMIEVGAPIEIVGVVDDSPSFENLERLESRGISYLGTVDQMVHSFGTDTKFVLGIGNPNIRKLLVQRIESAGFSSFTAIHPKANLGSQVDLAEGAVVCVGATISTNVKLQRHVHVNPGVIIGHDSVLEEFVSINPGAVISGEVTIRRLTLVGAAATILQQLVVGSNSIIGAGSCVTKDVPNDVIVTGLPGRWHDRARPPTP